MKGWKLTDKKTVLEEEIAVKETVSNASKVKVTKAMINLSDVLRYNGEMESENVILGSYGLGIISETDANLLGLERGKRVYIENYKPCYECFNCKQNHPEKCLNINTAAVDYDGFLCDFISIDSDKLFVLPDSVTDDEALFIGDVSLALSVIDSLGIKKGDYITIIGANNFAVILSQLLIYYQAVPIIVGIDEEQNRIARDSGIYYVLGPNDNWTKEVNAITGGRMTTSVVYISDNNISVNKAFALASHGANVAFTGISNKTGAIAFTQAIKKRLTIHCIANEAGNTSASINLLANKAINLSKLKIAHDDYKNVPAVFAKLDEEYETTGKVTETIIKVF